jgi:hypothetical protein
MEGGVDAGAGAVSTGSNCRDMRRNSPCPMRTIVLAWAEPIALSVFTLFSNENVEHSVVFDAEKKLRNMYWFRMPPYVIEDIPHIVFC